MAKTCYSKELEWFTLSQKNFKVVLKESMNYVMTEEGQAVLRLWNWYWNDKNWWFRKECVPIALEGITISNIIAGDLKQILKLSKQVMLLNLVE